MSRLKLRTIQYFDIIFTETLALQRNVDDNSRQILYDEAKALCIVTQTVCDSVEKCNMEVCTSHNIIVIKIFDAEKKLYIVFFISHVLKIR